MPASCLGVPPLNVVLLMLDDLRYDQVEVMPEVAARMEATGVTFTRAYQGTPLCAPMRASLLSGGFPAAETGVRTNDAPAGGVTAFVDTDTLPVRLQAAGYATGLVGKYLNGYQDLGAYVPPGWTEWAAWRDADDWSHYHLVEGTSGATAAEGVGVAHDTYIAEFQGEWAARFIGAHRDQPFFLDVGFIAPHEPHIPAAEDAGSYAEAVYRGGAYQEADVSDKPAWIQALPLLTAEEEALTDLAHRERQETLLAVDRAISRIQAALEASGVAERTVVVLVSDNGVLWGEHRLFDKGVPYQEAVHAPLLVWNPGLRAFEAPALVDPGLDIAATIEVLAGLTPRSRGIDLTPVLCGTGTTGRDHVLVQDWSRDGESWSGLVTARTTYVEWATGERELYDRDADPFEEVSLHDDPARAEEIADLAATLDDERALGGAQRALATATAGRPYTHSLEVWGGTPPLRWARLGGALPHGMDLDEDGVLTGTPREAGTFPFAVRVEDGSVSPVTGGPQSVVAHLTLTVEEAPDVGKGGEEPGCGCGAGRATGAAAWLAAALSWRRRRR